jgi:CheY-like chemotaxis protein
VIAETLRSGIEVGMKILVVDDDPLAITLIVAALAQYGFKDVVTATSGIEALKLIEMSGNRFECFLLDQKMPEMDGVTLCGYIRRYENYRTAPVIFISAVSDRACLDKAYIAGAVDYIAKPINPMEIGARVSVAEKLILEEKATHRASRQNLAARDKANRVLDFAIDEAVMITGPAMVGKLAFENYLQSLGPKKLYNCAVSAFAVNEFVSIFRRTSPTERFHFLTDIAKAITTSMKHTEKVLTYAGNGRFLCVTQRIEPAQEERLASYINANIAQFDLSYEDGSPCIVTVRVGKPVQRSLMSRGGPLQLMVRALEQVSENGRETQEVSPADRTTRPYTIPMLNC